MFGIFSRMDLLQPTWGAGISPEKRTIGATFTIVLYKRDKDKYPHVGFTKSEHRTKAALGRMSELPSFYFTVVRGRSIALLKQ